MGFVVRESHPGHPQTRKEQGSKGKAKSNWDLMGKGKGKGSLKGDLDQEPKGRPHSKSSHKGYESAKKKKA